MGKRYQVILFILLVVGGIFNFGLTVQAEGTIVRPIEINEANFPDEAFRDYLLEQDFGSNERLSGAEIEAVTSIDLSNKSSITSLQGIEYFQNLELLFCDNTSISELDVRNNTNLEHLSCSNTEISELDVRNNTNLEILFCDNTAISELDVRNNANLEMLICNNTEISKLDVRNNTNLQNLSCNNTKISELDVRNNTNLKVLYCDNTGISELDVRNNTNLQTFYCNNTGISELDVSNNNNLQNLVCCNTEISELDVRNNTNLELLFCFNTGISELDVNNNTNLVVLDCSGTIISNLDISKTSINPKDLIRYSEFSNCKTPVPLLSGNIIELSQLPGIDASKIVGTIENATLSENSIKVNNPSEVVSYTYDCGLDMKEIFTLEISSYEISYDANGGSGEIESDKVPSDGTEFTLPENSFTAPAYMQFKEWAIGSNKVKAGDTYTFTEATTVYAVWEPIAYTVDFKDEGQLLKSQTVEYGESAEAPEVAEKTGYINSWDVDFSKVTENLTVNLVQTPITYSIRFNINDGSTEAHTQEGLLYGQLQKLDANIFTREGYTFKGWSETASSPVLYTNEASVINLSAVDSAIVDLYAVWEKDKEGTFTVVFKDEEQILKTETVESGASATAPEVAEKTGYTNSWDADFSNITADLIVNLLQTPISYNIQFHINDETVETEEAEETHIQIDFKYNQSKQLDGNTFTREGYTFIGWSETESGPVLYTDEQLVMNLSEVDGDTVDLYAVWEKNSEEVTSNVITLNAYGGIGQMAKAMATKGIGYNRRP